MDHAAGRVVGRSRAPPRRGVASRRQTRAPRGRRCRRHASAPAPRSQHRNGITAEHRESRATSRRPRPAGAPPRAGSSGSAASSIPRRTAAPRDRPRGAPPAPCAGRATDGSGWRSVRGAQPRARPAPRRAVRALVESTAAAPGRRVADGEGTAQSAARDGRAEAGRLAPVMSRPARPAPHRRPAALGALRVAADEHVSPRLERKAPGAPSGTPRRCRRCRRSLGGPAAAGAVRESVTTTGARRRRRSRRPPRSWLGVAPERDSGRRYCRSMSGGWSAGALSRLHRSTSGMIGLSRKSAYSATAARPRCRTLVASTSPRRSRGIAAAVGRFGQVLSEQALEVVDHRSCQARRQVSAPASCGSSRRRTPGRARSGGRRNRPGRGRTHRAPRPPWRRPDRPAIGIVSEANATVVDAPARARRSARVSERVVASVPGR